VPAGAVAAQWLTIAALGFCIYGPQMLIGLAGAELVSPSAVGASQGILGWIAYLGAFRRCAIVCVCVLCCFPPLYMLSAVCCVRVLSHNVVVLPRVFFLTRPPHPTHPQTQKTTTKGAANAGIPLSHLVQSQGWGAFFTALLGACGVALLLLAFVANAQSFGQRDEAGGAAKAVAAA
jgi:sugar phosphate permease